jgi:hemerythrin superfamily protein
VEHQFTTGASADAIELLSSDHREVEQLFRQFEATTDGALAQELAERLVCSLSVHAAIEEQLLYPAARRALDDGGLVDHAIEEHDELKRVLADVDGKPATDEAVRAGMRRAQAMVEEHVAEEEGTLFPQLRDGMSQEELQKLGTAMELAKQAAPTHPHPNAPSTPPGNLVLGPVMALVDKVRDAARDALSRRD